MPSEVPDYGYTGIVSQVYGRFWRVLWEQPLLDRLELARGGELEHRLVPRRRPLVQGDHEEGEVAGIRDAAQEDAVRRVTNSVLVVLRDKNSGEARNCWTVGRSGRLPQLRDTELGSRLVRTPCPGFARRAWSRTLSLDRGVKERWPGKRILENR